MNGYEILKQLLIHVTRDRVLLKLKSPSFEDKSSNNDEFIQLLESIEVISSHLSTDTKLLEEVVNIEHQKHIDISLKDLWLNILETEKDILPTITITSKGKNW